ncbi:MAG: RHS repeat-associated core domain-containing protein, partial [Bacteroidia bacterium]
ITFTDIFFHDDLTGYVVGTKGCVLRSTAFAFSSTTGLFTSGSWLRKNTDDSLGGQTDSTKMGESTIAFATRHDGFFGGTYDNTSQPTAQVGLARNVHDESDEFSTYFWYDKLGRIVLSQNSRQHAQLPKRYSYSTYDALGRVNEAGEKYENSYGDAQMSSIFGSYINVFYNPKVIDDTKLTAWITETSGIRTEVMHTYYDTTVASIASYLPNNFSQDNLRKRVACVTYCDTLDGYDSTYNYATHYSYDIHGNVKTLLQDNKALATIAPGGALSEQEFKQLNYSYDLISGNVKNVDYQNDSADQMHHRYEYDADNRITQVETSTDAVLWDKDAKYFYYAHGPLARTELGNDEVQGIDYAYTLQGWIKGVNSNTLDSTRDIGRDADTLLANANRLFGKDVYGYTLNYFDGDYKPIDAANKWTTATDRFEANKAGSDLLAARNNYFNGNISAMVTTITDTDDVALPQGMAYTYDQLNRLLNAEAYTNINVATNTWSSGSTYANRYYNAFSYDANGNILGQLRYDQAGNAIDSLKYRYERDANGKMLRNRLYHVNDTVAIIRHADDIDDEGSFSSSIATINTANNYGYDAEGRLVRDDQEEIAQIVWTVTGKVKEVIRSIGSSKKNLKFDYDAMGMRVAKHIFDSSNNWEKSTYYVRDPQGNVMATYDHEVASMTISYKLKERDIYGSSRLGMKTDTLEMIGATVDTSNFSHSVGQKFYELANHLGNVLSVVTDKILPKDWNNDTIVDNYVAEIVSATDYYAFGAPMKGRNFTSSTGGYRYAFNGKEKVDEMHGNDGDSYDFGARMYDARLGRWTSIDNFWGKNSEISPYVFAGNMPIVAIDANGDSIYFVGQANANYESAMTTLLQTPNGQELVEKYKNSTTADVYIAVSNSYDASSNTLAATYPPDATSALIVDYKVDVSVATAPISTENFGDFNGLDVTKSVGKSISLISINQKKAETANKYQLAEVIYHELDAHIDNAQTKMKLSQERYAEEHFQYGSSSTENGGAEPPSLNTVSPGTPAFNIRMNLIDLKNFQDGKTKFSAHGGHFSDNPYGTPAFRPNTQPAEAVEISAPK